MNRRSCLKLPLALSGMLLLPAAIVAVTGRSGLLQSAGRNQFGGQIMGTGYSVLLGVDGPASALLAELRPRVHAALQQVDRRMSTWQPASELSVFNQRLDSNWQTLSAETVQVIAQALDTGASSRGAFDLTVGPLVDLWGFGAPLLGGDVGGVPHESAIEHTLARVNYSLLQADTRRNSVRKLRPDLRLDLSGIAKGHAVDRVAAVLDSYGVERYLVEVGGELKTRGTKADGSAWRVAIERPAQGLRRDAFAGLQLNGQAVATSGDYRNFFASAGQRYSHAIDPRTGWPVAHRLASVTVVADTAMQADALSTAMMIMGPDEAMAYAEQHQLAMHLILKTPEGLKEQISTAFEPLRV